MTVRTIEWRDAPIEWWANKYTSGELHHNTFFQSPAWVLNWKRHYVDTHPRREALLLLVEEQGNVTALIPLFIRERSFGPFRGWRSLHIIGERLAQYTDIITVTENTKLLWKEVVYYLGREFPEAWLEMYDILPQSTAYGTGGDTVTEGESYLRLSLDRVRSKTLEALVQPHMRRELLRCKKLMASDPSLHWSHVTAPDKDLLTTLISLNRSRFGVASFFEDEGNRAFFLELCALADRETWCSVLRHDEKIISVLMGHSHGGSMLFLLSGFDTAYRALSPGTMNLGNTIIYAADHGFTYFDFLRGDEAYKQEFNAERRMSQHQFFIPPKARCRKRLVNTIRRSGNHKIM